VPHSTRNAIHCAVSSDQEVISKLAETDMLVSDLERANSRVATVERRNVMSSFMSLQYLNVSLNCHLGTFAGGD
jgi:hypothetical protein